jgi:hypothetical protein
MEAEGSFQCSQEPTNGPYHESYESSPHPICLIPYCPEVRVEVSIFQLNELLS